MICRCDMGKHVNKRRAARAVGRSTPADVESLFLFAQTTGGLYNGHVMLARQGATLSDWAVYVTGNVLPRYKHEIENKVFTMGHVVACATQLRAYYTAHVKEAQPRASV